MFPIVSQLSEISFSKRRNGQLMENLTLMILKLKPRKQTSKSTRFAEFQFECVLGVPVPDKQERSLITWDRSQNAGCFGTGPITIFIEQFFG